MAFDGNSQTVEFIKPNVFLCPGLSIILDNGFDNKLCLRLFEFGKDNGRLSFGGLHGVVRNLSPIGGHRN